MEEIQCAICARPFETAVTDGGYYLEGWRISEYHPREAECSFCRGEETCRQPGCEEQATVLDTESWECLCIVHWQASRLGGDCTPQEWEDFALHLSKPSSEGDAPQVGAN